MEFNEISLLMDVKLDIYDKRPESLKFKTWTRCQVKIEAIKCLPCFLRISIQSLVDATKHKDSSSKNTAENDDRIVPPNLSVSINVPGVSISLATSRTKQHSFGLFWTHNRRDCFIYFALETELTCRKQMKWLKRSIKNLELYRQVLLEQKRNSRGPAGFLASAEGAASARAAALKEDKRKELSAIKDALTALGPLPKIPDSSYNLNWSRRVSRASEIYEEIFEGHIPPRLSRRLSRASIASGIYEEMKPCSPPITKAISEEAAIDCPPPLPPLPQHRKRINTFDTENNCDSGEIPRCNTNPESDLVKKKKYRNVLDNLFGSSRAKRTESVSETPTCTMEDILNYELEDPQHKEEQPLYANEILKQTYSKMHAESKRNSFSSPDLSKINFLDTFDEDKIAALLKFNNSNSLDDEHDIDLDSLCEISAGKHNLSSISLDDSFIQHQQPAACHNLAIARIQALRSKAGSIESLNISEHLPQNFNFSACNTSSINLIGASGAVPSLQKFRRNRIVIEDDLTGYCVMAPILSKAQDDEKKNSASSAKTSGYSSTTSSSCSSKTNSAVDAAKEKDAQQVIEKRQTFAIKESDYDELPLRKTPLPVAAVEYDSKIYENMQSGSPLNCSIILKAHDQNSINTPPSSTSCSISKDFTGNLYENLLTIKAAQELEQPLLTQSKICTSTPTESPATDKESAAKVLRDTSSGGGGGGEEEVEGENFYQTPRKSLISVDDKVPSYYPNSCDTLKMRRSPTKASVNTPSPTSTKSTGDKEKSSNNSLGLKHLVNIKMKRERKENLYISSPQKILEQRKKSTVITTSSTASTSSSATTAQHSSLKSRKSVNAQKISENVYTVNLSSKKPPSNYNNNNNDINEKSQYSLLELNAKKDAVQLNGKLQNELLQIALIQNIDFKFDDTNSSLASTSSSASSVCSFLTNKLQKHNENQAPPQQQCKESGIAKLEQAELEYEATYQATKDATRLLHKYATLAPQQSRRIQQQLQHHLQVHQSTNQQKSPVAILMTQSTKLDSPAKAAEDVAACEAANVGGTKKFASLPRFKKIDFSPLKLKINNVLQRNQPADY